MVSGLSEASRCVECASAEREERKAKREKAVSIDTHGREMRKCGQCGQSKDVKTNYPATNYAVCQVCRDRQSVNKSVKSSKQAASSSPSSSSSFYAHAHTPPIDEILFPTIDEYEKWRADTLTDAPVDLHRKLLEPGADVDAKAEGFKVNDPRTYILKQVSCPPPLHTPSQPPIMMHAIIVTLPPSPLPAPHHNLRPCSCIYGGGE